MLRKKASIWLFAILSVGFLLLSGSLAFASLAAGWPFPISQDMTRLPKVEFSPEPFSSRVIQANRSAGESYFFEYEAWRRIQTSA